MNKKIFILGAAALATAGYITLTSFGGMTKVQQEAGIADKITAALADIKAAKAKECDEKVATAAATKAQELMAAAPTETPKGVAGPSKPKKPTTTKKPGAKDPAPQAPSVPPAKAPEKSGGKFDRNETGAPPAPSKFERKDPAAPPTEAPKKSKFDRKEGGGK